MENGFLGIILHAHLPFVRHPEHPSFFEENWLFEAMTECYVPLLEMLDRLENDRIDYRLTLSLSPPLISMLRDELLQSRYLQHLHKLIELAEKETVRTRREPELNKLARLYRRFYRHTLDFYQNRCRGDLPGAFGMHQAHGKLELITTAATHGFLPLLSVSETAVRNQIRVGIDTFRRHFGFAPKGFWLPECGYYPGLETFLKEAGIAYFFVDSHSLLNANRPPVNGVYAPLACENGVAAFARDPESSEQVWSSQQGYPGDFDYREYYRDIGFDLDLDYIGPYLVDGRLRANTGIKYYRVTGENRPKQPYDPSAARAKAELHAQDFIQKRRRQTDALAKRMDRPPLIVAPYDAELFGHWWFEGPHWLEQVLRIAGENGIRTVSCADDLQRFSSRQAATPSAATWGEHGYSSYWINETNDWIYPYLHQAGRQLEAFVAELKGISVNPLQERAFNQAVRSLLLAQSSDWPFIMKSGTTVDYAIKRITDHLARFNYLYDSLRKGKIDERYLSALEIMDNIFPDIDFRNYCA
jgi:1,4-alpha-glucan branching enzyme